jgi:3-methyladenine DNA glycosylase AlkD
MPTLQKFKSTLLTYADKKKAVDLTRFFQVFPGGYGEGDTFLGVKVPDQRTVAKQFFKELNLDEIALLLNENIHEHRLTAVFMLVLKYEKSKTEEDKQAVVDCYLENISGVNNWDIIDSSCHKILGPWLIDKDKNLLYEFAHSGDLWLQRISIITTMHFIYNRQFDDAFRLAEILLQHPHDLIHKAVGWMLREIGNRDYDAEYSFLVKHYRQMPRTMLRYAIEKFDEDVRQGFLKGIIGAKNDFG